MIPSFEFVSAGRIIFGPGAVSQVPAAAADTGRRALVVHGKNSERIAPLVRGLESAGVSWAAVSTPFEPTPEMIMRNAEIGRKFGADLVIAMGGGSVLDAGKAVAAMIRNPGDILPYLEVIGQGRPLPEIPLPCIAIPTTAGTGSEVTKNAVLKSPEHGVKVSLRHPAMLPRLAVVDPGLCRSLPPAVTAATGADALTQLLEALVSRKATPMTDALCREALPRAIRSLVPCVENGDDMAARTDLSLAALFSGLALANGGLGAVHGIAGPLGGRCDAPHGAVCAALLPHVWAANIRYLQEAGTSAHYLERFAEAARLLTGNPDAAPEDGAEKLAEMVSAIRIPALSHWGLAEPDLSPLAAQSLKASSMKGNPIDLTEQDLMEILQKAL